MRDVLAALVDLGATPARTNEQIDAAFQRAPFGDVGRWLRVLDDLGTSLLDAVTPAFRAELAGRLARTHRLVYDAIVVERVRENHRAKLELDFGRAVAQDLLAAANRAALLDSLRLKLSGDSDFAGYHLSLQEADPGWSRLVSSSAVRDASVDRGVRFSTRAVLPQAAFPRAHAVTLCAASLSDGTSSHGTLIVEAPLEDGRRVSHVARQVGIWLGAHARTHEATGPRAERVEGIPERIGDYPIVQRIGVGGMATVYLAETQVAGVPRPVALELLHPHLQERTWSEQFVEEARVSAAIRHPNVVQLLELGEHKGGMFLVMDFVEGADLGVLLTRQARDGEGLPARIAGRILADALAGLAAAHDRRSAFRRVVNGRRGLGALHRKEDVRHARWSHAAACRATRCAGASRLRAESAKPRFQPSSGANDGAQFQL